MKKVSSFLIGFVLLCLSVSASAQSLDSLLAQAVNENLTLSNLHNKFKIQELNEDQVSQLPAPQVGVGAPVLPAETRLGPQVLMVGASQMFPWFGTYRAKKEVVVQMSKVEYEQINIERLAVFHKIKSAYYNLQFLNKKESILRLIKEQYELLKAFALGNVAAGMASVADVLRVQLKMDEVDQLIEVVEYERLKQYSVINQLTNQPTEQEVRAEGMLTFPEITFDLEAMENKIEDFHPVFVQLNNQLAVSKSKQIVNRKMGAPSIGFGVDYVMVNPRTDMNPEFNGRDIFVPKLSVKLPIYRKSFRAKDVQERLIQESIELSKRDINSQMMKSIVQEKAKLEMARSEIELVKGQMVTIERTYSILLDNYSATGKGFDDLLQIQGELLRYQLIKAKSVLAACLVEANIEHYVEF